VRGWIFARKEIGLEEIHGKEVWGIE